MSKKQIIAGNWKMNGNLSMAASYLDELKNQSLNPEIEVIICPPYTLLTCFANNLPNNIFLGSQDCYTSIEGGASTGDISIEMIKDLSCKYTIVGHSERRTKHHETNYLVNKKAELLQISGITPIVCVGEKEEERDSGKTEEVLSKQVKYSLPKNFDKNPIIVAYEPIWAIGTGKIPSNEDIESAIAVIRDVITTLKDKEVADRIHILYGGSVNISNAKDILLCKGVDGLLVGGASLNCNGFIQIANAKLQNT